MSLGPNCTEAASLFLHVPRITQGRREIMVMPLGLPALANSLEDEGIASSIMHLGIEQELNPRFSLRSAFGANPPRLLLLSLHWYLQTRPVLNAANRIRSWLPHTKIVLGGLTASVFAREILEQLRFVDAVVRGDGELPLATLTRRLDSGDWRDVPNLVWRDASGGLHDNGLSYQLDAEGAARLRHGSLAHLRHREAYLQRALYADFSEGAEEGGYARAAYLNAGRGCTVSCVNCGGAASAQTVTCGRKGVLLYPIQKLMRDVHEAVDEGARVLRMSFDPPAARRHLVRWFEAITALDASLRLVFDCWFLPSDALLNSMAQCFAAGSTLVLSPECGSEAVRERVRGLSFSNDDLLGAVREIEVRGFRAHCFFSAGLPTETPSDLDETVRLIHRIRRETKAGISVCPMVADPASPLFFAPERWGATLTRRSLRDFYDEKGVPGGPGYATKWFSETQILAGCDRLLREAGLPTVYGR